MAVVLKVEGDLISQVRFSIYGCSVAASCGQFVCDQIEGNSVDHVAGVNEAAIVVEVGKCHWGGTTAQGWRLEHCATLLPN